MNDNWGVPQLSENRKHLHHIMIPFLRRPTGFAQKGCASALQDLFADGSQQ